MTDHTPMLAQAYRLISLLHEHACETALIEITAMGGKYPMKRYLTDAAISAAHAVELNLQGMSAFVNVNPRSAFSGFERDVPFVTALFLDLQPAEITKRLALTAGVDSIDEVKRRLALGRIPPTVTVTSGNGFHMYLKLSRPADPQKAKIVWERLVRFTGSDPVHSVNRIARLPGTVNWKQPPRWCFMMEADIYADRLYDLDEIDIALDRLGAGPARPQKEGIPVPEDPPVNWLELRKRLPEGVLDIIDTGEKNAFSERQVTRSEADWVVVCALVRAGCPDLMVHWVYETQPVGIMKYRESGARYLNKTIEAARRATAEPIEPVGRGRAYDAPKNARGSSGDSYRKPTNW
jgi:hypothetical protein